jgi:hypothetical protein
MASKRADSFRIALEALREELRSGAHPAGARLTANAIAARLSLSATPAREALSRLAGEGLLIDRRGQGFFVPKLEAHDLAALLRLELELMLIVTQGEPPLTSGLDVDRLLPEGGAGSHPRDIVLASERLLRVLAASSSPALARHLGRLHDQLAPVRAMEGQVLDQLAPELAELASTAARGAPEEIRRSLHAFFDRRIRAAPALVRHYEAAKTIESI